MLYIVCYDTPSDRRRRKLSRFLEDYLSRIQESVFEGRLEPGKFEELVREIPKYINVREDRVRIYGVPEDAISSIKVYGFPPLTFDPKYYLI